MCNSWKEFLLRGGIMETTKILVSKEAYLAAGNMSI